MAPWAHVHHDTGRDTGFQGMSHQDSFVKMVTAEYVWLDGNGNTRSKCKTITRKPESPDDCGIFLVDGASTGQANDTASEIYLVPRSCYDAPDKGPGHVYVVAEAVTASMEPASGNYRAACHQIYQGYAKHKCSFLFHQRYMVDDGSGVSGKNVSISSAYGVMGDTCYPPLGKLRNRHMALCQMAGVKIWGSCAGASKFEGEFSVGFHEGVIACDHVIMARHFLKVAADQVGAQVSFTADNSMYVGMSTVESRMNEGFYDLQNYCRKMEKTPIVGVAYGGDDSSLGSNFTWGVAETNASVSIPRTTAIAGKGFFVDQRPKGDADPYRVMALLVKHALG